MAGTTKAAEKAVQEPTEAKAEAKVYNLRSSNKYLTVSSGSYYMGKVRGAHCESCI